MKKSIRIAPKKRRGRPSTTGKGVQVGERWHAAELAAIDAWISKRGHGLTRARAIRRLVAIGLLADKRNPAVDPGIVRKAMEAIDRSSAEMIALGRKVTK